MTYTITVPDRVNPITGAVVAPAADFEIEGENLGWHLAEKAGDFSLSFDAKDTTGSLCLPWTLSFTDPRDNQERHFMGACLDDVFSWALGFIDGKLELNGLAVNDAALTS